MTNTSLEVIGYVRCDYKEKFGIPRQSGLTDCATAFIEMLPPYNQAEAFRGLDGFSHIWLLWDFSRAHKNGFTATVKPQSWAVTSGWEFSPPDRHSGQTTSVCHQ